MVSGGGGRGGRRGRWCAHALRARSQAAEQKEKKNKAESPFRDIRIEKVGGAVRACEGWTRALTPPRRALCACACA